MRAVSKPFDCVVAADAAWGIGSAGDLPWPKLREDLRFLKRLTTTVPDGAPPGAQNAVIMGRKTYASIPAGLCPLPGRINVAVTRGGQPVPAGVLAATSLDDALDRAEAAGAAALFVLGGGEIYRLAFAHPRCRDVYLTRVDATFTCDTFIAPLAPAFALAEVLADHVSADGIAYHIERWRRAATPPPGT